MTVPQKPIRLTLALALTLSAAPELAAGDRPPQPRARQASSITIVQRIGPAERAARERAERQRRAAAGPRLAAWCRGYRAALRPLTAATAETLRSLEVAWGPDSRHLGYQVAVAAGALRDGHLPAPDPDLDRQLRTALLHFEDGAAACRQGMPTTAQRLLGTGRRWLADAERTLAVYAAEGWACETGERGGSGATRMAGKDGAAGAAGSQ